MAVIHYDSSARLLLTHYTTQLMSTLFHGMHMTGYDRIAIETTEMRENDIRCEQTSYTMCNSTLHSLLIHDVPSCDLT